MKIRKAKLKDFEEYFKLLMMLRKESRRGLSGFLLDMLALKKNHKKELRKEFRKFVYSPDKVIYFAEEDGKIMGFIEGSIQNYGSYFRHPKNGHIEGMVVRKEKRKKGVSSLLKEELFKWFKSKKLKYIGLDVMETNKYAQEVYKKWGFSFFARKMKLRLK